MTVCEKEEEMWLDNVKLPRIHIPDKRTVNINIELGVLQLCLVPAVDPSVCINESRLTLKWKQKNCA